MRPIYYRRDDIVETLLMELTNLIGKELVASIPLVYLEPGVAARSSLLNATVPGLYQDKK